MNTVRGLLALALLSLLPSIESAHADRGPGTHTPDRLDFGVVYQGAIVEGTMRVHFKPQDIAGLETKITPPDFVSVTNAQLATQTIATDEVNVFDLTVSISTKKVGEFKGKVSVEVDGVQSTFPVIATVRPADEARSKLLVLQTPYEFYSTGQSALFDSWREISATSKIDASYLYSQKSYSQLRELDLQTFDVVLLAETSLLNLTDDDKKKLMEYVATGGRLVVCANSFYVGTMDKANEWLALAGMEMLDEEFSETVPRGLIPRGKMTTGVQVLDFFRCSPTKITDTSVAKILVPVPDNETLGLIAVGRYKRGEIVSLGQSLWWNWVGAKRHADSDNVRMLRQMVIRLTD